MKKFNDIEERITKVGEKLWDYTFPKGTTRLYQADFTEKERKIFELFDEVIEKYSPNLPPSDVLERMNPLYNAMQRIYIQRAVDIFTHIVGPILYMGENEKTEEFDIKLLEAQLYNFIFRRVRDRNDERAWTNVVHEVFGHTNFDDLPDTEADPPDPGWLKVDAIMEEYHANREQREKKEEKELLKNFR